MRSLIVILMSVFSISAVAKDNPCKDLGKLAKERKVTEIRYMKPADALINPRGKSKKIYVMYAKGRFFGTNIVAYISQYDLKAIKRATARRQANVSVCVNPFLRLTTDMKYAGIYFIDGRKYSTKPSAFRH